MMPKVDLSFLHRAQTTTDVELLIAGLDLGNGKPNILHQIPIHHRPERSVLIRDADARLVSYPHGRNAQHQAETCPANTKNSP